MTEQRKKMMAWDGTKMAEFREVKYQVWDIEMKTMLTWEEVLDEVEAEGIYLMLSMLRQDHYIMLQFTDQNDKANAEIYAGDILEESDYKRDPHFRYTVQWDGHQGRWIAMNTGRESLRCGNSFHKLEKIGNIYENPELLQAAG